MSKKTALHLCLSIATSSATTLPAYLLGEALKLVPYLGLAAMAVDASTAFASTVALGAVSMKLLRQARGWKFPGWGKCTEDFKTPSWNCLKQVWGF